MDIDITTLDNSRELHFAWYLEELAEHDYIWGYESHPLTFFLSPMVKVNAVDRLLKTKVNYKEQGLLREDTYTPDFTIFWKPRARGIFYELCGDGLTVVDKDTPFLIPSTQTQILRGKHEYYIGEECEISTVDCKPDVKTRFATNVNSIYTFPIEQKWVYDKFGVYVQKVVHEGKKTCMFAETFTPRRYLTNDKLSTRRTIHHDTPNIESYVLNKKEKYVKIKRRLGGQGILFS